MVKIRDNYDRIEVLEGIRKRYPKLFHWVGHELYFTPMDKKLICDIAFEVLVSLHANIPEEFFLNIQKNKIIYEFETNKGDIERELYHIFFEYDISVRNLHKEVNVESIYRTWNIDKIIND